MKVASKTDIGFARTVNEDRHVMRHLNGLTLAVVADGMGGHQGGDIASQTAIEVIERNMRSVHAGMSMKECRMMLKEAVVNANRKIYEMALQNEHLRGMGTTVVAALLNARSMLIAHIGDSRAYKISAQSVVQLTQDHSLVNELVRSGQITQEEAFRHPRKNVLTRALGTNPKIELELHEYEWQPNDLLLLCSDGLSNLVDVDKMKDILFSSGELSIKADQLVKCALDAGGNDNITVVLVENTEPDGPEANHSLKGGMGA